MSNSYFKRIMFYSIRQWFYLTFVLSPMLIFVYLIDFLNLESLTWFIVFLVLLAVSIGIVSLSSHRFRRTEPPKLVMKRSQWNLAIELLGWLARHEFVSFGLLMLGLIIIFLPLNALWALLVSAGIVHSASSAFVFLMLLVLPFFIIPSSTMSVIYESIVHPHRPSLFQINKIIQKIYALKQPTGEDFERAKKTIVRTTHKLSKPRMVLLLSMLTTGVIILQLRVLGFLSHDLAIFIWFFLTVIPAAIILLLLFFSGEKRTRLDLLIDSEEENPKPKQETELVSSVSRITSSIHKALDTINERWWYKLLLVSGGILSFVVSLLRLLGLI